MNKRMIEVKNVTKAFHVWNNAPYSFKNMLIRLCQGKWNFFHDKKIRVVLEDISFDIDQGEFVGIMGKNGCGKSTLFKLMSGIYLPTKGDIKNFGTIAPLIELGAGFHPDLTGYENIFLNAAILGFGKKAIQKVCQKIIDFSELEEHIHTSIRVYSSGMLARLGFSIAVQLEAPILLIDEILAVGDMGFQKKCLSKIYELYHEGRTIVLITHDADAIKKYCTRCIVLDQGKKIYDGMPEKGTQIYQDLFM